MTAFRDSVRVEVHLESLELEVATHLGVDHPEDDDARRKRQHTHHRRSVRFVRRLTDGADTNGHALAGKGVGSVSGAATTFAHVDHFAHAVVQPLRGPAAANQHT